MRIAVERIKLTDGSLVRIDSEDLEKVRRYKWYLYKARGQRYVIANTYVGGRRTTIKMHRLIMGARDGFTVDHIDRDTLNNSKSNLRICSVKNNCRNSGSRRGAKSRFKGVYCRKSGFEASIRVNYRPIYLGLFKDEVSAARAYDRAARKYYRKYAGLNFPEAKCA